MNWIALVLALQSPATPPSPPNRRFEDGAAWHLIHRAQRNATGAQLSLAALADAAFDLPADTTLIDAPPRLVPIDDSLVVIEMSGEALKATLERSAAMFATYRFGASAPLADSSSDLERFESLGGAHYAIDLTRAVGDRVRQLTVADRAVLPNDRFTVAMPGRRAAALLADLAFHATRRTSRRAGTVRGALTAALAARGTEPDDGRTWTLWPDYVTTTERPLIDRLVREGIAPASQVTPLGCREPAERGDGAYWLARAFGWHERRQSGAFVDVPDSLEAWLDGLLKHNVLGDEGQLDEFRPFAPIPLGRALNWCEAAGRAAGYAFDHSPNDPAFRRGLLMDIALIEGEPGRYAYRDTLTRGQLLGIISNARFPTIRVLETTDVHGAILPERRDHRSGRPIGGSAVLAAYIARLSAEDPAGTVLIDGGDWFQGTMISNLRFGRPMVEQMNALGYVAAAIGNHEFDWGTDTLERRVREFHGAALGANLKQRSDGRRPAWARADTMVIRRGVRIGILGLCYPGTASVTLARNVAHLRFEDDSAAAVPLARALRQRGATLVIGVGHIPGTTDSARPVGGDIARLARTVPGVDAWFGGHSHNRVMGDVNGVPVMVPGAYAEMIGVCDLVIDPVGHRVIEHHSRLVSTYGDVIVPDSAMAARVVEWNRDIGPLAAEPLGRNARALTRVGLESTIGDLVADAMRVGAHTDVALTNPGGLRADLAAGVVTRGMLYEVMPFDNMVVTVRLSGAELRQVLEGGLGRGRTTQVSGIRFTIDRSRPTGSRVGELTFADGRPLAPGADVSVAVNDFMVEGGDDDDTLSRARHRIDTGVTVRQRLEEWVRAASRDGGALDVRVDGRVRNVEDSTPR